MVPVSSASEALSLATYNLQNYRLSPHEGFSAKSLKSCLAAQELAIECNADVLLIQEIGSEKALKHFQAGLSQKGLHYPHYILARLPDASIHLGLLSRLPPLRSQHHTNAFVLYGKAFRPSRGFLEVDFQVSKNRQIKIWGIHLKSKRPDLRADSWDLRTREAGLLRSLVNQTLKEQPDQWMAVLGDFNDDPRSHTLEILRGKGRTAFLDTRPLLGSRIHGRCVRAKSRLLGRTFIKRKIPNRGWIMFWCHDPCFVFTNTPKVMCSMRPIGLRLPTIVPLLRIFCYLEWAGECSLECPGSTTQGNA